MSDFLMKCRCGRSLEFNDASSGHRADLIGEKQFDLLLARVAGEIAELMRFEMQGRRSEWIWTRIAPSCPLDIANEDIVSDLINRERGAHSYPVLQCPACGALYVSKWPFSWKEFWEFTAVGAPNDMFSRME